MVKTNFNTHSQVIRVPRLVTAEVRGLSPVLLSGDQAAIDAHLDNLIVQEELAAANAEVDHRMTAEELDEYNHALERAQRKLGVRSFNPPAGDTF